MHVLSSLRRSVQVTAEDPKPPAAEYSEFLLDSESDDLAPEFASLAPELETDGWQESNAAADLAPDITSDGPPE
jgi:hypothetical protein